MQKESIILEVSKSLEEVYVKYSNKGMLACYIWGSLLTDDFNIQTSDVDTIAIVDDNFELEKEEEIQKELNSKYPEISKFGFRILYKSEFDGSVCKSNLAKVANPFLLLLDLPTWKWVCGKKFIQDDFKLTVPTIKEAIMLQYEQALSRWPDINLIKPEQIQYFVKQILRIAHLKIIYKNNSEYNSFSYSGIKMQTQGTDEEKVVQACLDIKFSNWNFDKFNSYKDILSQYILDLNLE